MGPPVGSRTPNSRTPRTDTDSKPTHASGADQPGNSPHSGSKRSAQHAQYHNAETKRRKEGAERAANIQQHATQLVQQLAAPDGDSIPQETSGTLAKAEDRQITYNVSIDSKPWASGRDKVSHSVNPTAGLPMQTGHYYDTDTSSEQPSGHASSDAAAEGSAVEQTNSEPVSDNGEGDQENKKHSEAAEGSPVEQPSSEPSSNHGEGDQEGKKHSEAGSQSPSISDGANFSSTQKFKHGDRQSNPGMAAIKDRQMDEQTHQNHPQNCSESEPGKSLPPVIQQLQRAQQRAHDELEAAEKESSDYRFPAEAGQSFVTNARKNKAKLDVAVYEHGRIAPSCSLKQ